MPEERDRSEERADQPERDPRSGPGKGGFPAQEQEWPGSEQDMHPRADHGEESYRGSGQLSGLRALITGGDSGIGRAVAIAFAREGADVAISYYDEDQDARQTVDWIERAGRTAASFGGDIAEEGWCREVVHRTVEQLGGVNVLVNNAALHVPKDDFLEISAAQLEKTFRTNFFSYIWMAQAALPYMRAGDCIINTGSVTGLRGHATLLDYAATKAAIHNFTRSLAQVLADRGIRVNCVAPGPVWTPLIPATKDAQKVAEHGATTLWERAAQPAELAPSYVFLASGASRYYTGETLAPTGFQTATR